MKKEKVTRLLWQTLEEEYEYLEKNNYIIIAKYITKHKGKALYYNPTNGVIKNNDIDFRDTHKYETKDFKLMRFLPAYWDVAKVVAITYMKNNSCGYSLYTESGFIAG